MNRRCSPLFAVLLVAAIAALATTSCGGGGDSSSSGASSVTTAARATEATGTAGPAAIDTFNVPSTVACGTETSTTVTVQYAVSHAARQQLVVDGLDVKGTAASTGSVQVPIHCDPLPHTFVLVVYDAAGHRTSQQKILQISG